MDFFVNNQFRIMVEGCATSGSSDVQQVLETTLQRIGQLVAVLDTWNEPIYLRRVWTVYELFVACSLQVPVTFVMPEEASASRLKDNDLVLAFVPQAWLGGHINVRSM